MRGYKGILLMLGSAVILCSLATPTYAFHGKADAWPQDLVYYKCHYTLYNLNFEQDIDPCSYLEQAFDVWNDIPSSDLSFQPTTGPASIAVKSGDMPDMDLGYAYVGASGGVIHYAYITFDIDSVWGDRDDVFIDWWTHDYLTIAAHEVGHLIPLEHDENSPLMKENHPVWEKIRNPSPHDIEVVQEKY